MVSLFFRWSYVHGSPLSAIVFLDRDLGDLATGRRHKKEGGFNERLDRTIAPPKAIQRPRRAMQGRRRAKCFSNSPLHFFQGPLECCLGLITLPG